MANFFDDLMDMFSGNKKKEQGAEQAPSLLNPITEAWTGFLNKVNESAKQNIQSGHYTVAQPQQQQQQTGPALDLSMQPQEMSWEELARGAADKLTEMITGKKKAPWETENPFGLEELNDRYKQTVIELADADPERKNKNIFKDAYFLTSGYMDDTLASYDLVKGSDVNPLNVAESEWRKALDAKIGEYSAVGKGAEELEKMLEEGHFETEKQYREKQDQGIIAAASALRDKNEPTWRMGTEQEQQEKENRAGAYERLPEILENVWQNGGMAYGLSNPNDAALYQKMMNSPKGKALIDRYMQGTASAEDVRRYGQTMAEAVRGGKPKEMTLDEAEKYLREQYPMYDLAKDTQGSMDAYGAAYNDVRAIGLKAAKGEELTDTERQVWSEAVQEMPWLSDWRINLDSTGKSMDVRFGLNMEQQAELEAYGKTKAQQIADVAGLYSPYTVSPKNQAIWEAYTRTQEGAARWVEDAQGTKDEQKAKDNLWIVERQSKYDEVAKRPDFAETGKAKEDFHSGDNEFDQTYNIINNLNNAAGNEMMIAISGGRANKYLNYNQFMTEKEKGVFNSYAHAGATKEALEYLDVLSYAINERMANNAAKAMKSLGENGFAGGAAASIASVPFSISRGIGYVDVLGQKIGQVFNGRPVDMNSPANMVGRMADSAREGVQNQVDWNVNILGQDVDVFDFLYGTAMSGIDSFTAGQLGAALGGIASSAEKARKVASWTGAAILGGGAAQSAMQEAYDRGANDGTALLMGAIAGANETLWERWSIGNLIEHGQDVGKKAFAEEIKNVLTEAGVNASEEFNTSVANGIAEYFLNHDDREVQKKADEYERLGLSPEAALEKARGEFWASAVMDAAGGLLMGGAFGVVENVQNRKNVNQIDRTVGKGFSPESIDTMYSLAESENASEKAKEIIKKHPKEKANARQMGELFRELSNTMGKGIKETLHNMGVSDIALQLGQETGAVDRAAAEAVTAMMEGENLTGEQVAAIAANPAAMKIVDELFKPDTQAKGEAAGTGAAAGEGVSGAAARISQEPVKFEPMPGMEMPGKIDTSARGSAAGAAAEAPKINVQTVIGQDKSAAAQRIESIDEDEGGGVRVKLEDGQSVDLEDAGLSAPMQEVARAAAGMDRDKAAALMNAAEETLKKGTEGMPASEGESADAGETDEASARLAADVAAGRDFALGFSAVYDAAAKGQTREQVRTVYGEQLQEDVREKAYEAGRQAFERLEEQARQRNMEEAKAFGFRTVAETVYSPAPGRDTYSNRGAPTGVLFDRVGDSLRDKDGNADNGKLLALKLIDRVFKQTGMQARVVDKLENDANGKFVHGTNIVYLSMDAEEGAITKAASHEGFHFISQFSPDMKKTITDFVLDRLGRVEGYDLEQRIKEVRQQYRDGAGQELEQGEDRYHDGAIEEIVADSMLDVIGTEENMRALMKESKSTAEKIKEWIVSTYQRFKDILNRLAGYSPEVKALKDDVDYLGKISEMWNEGARQAAEAWQQAQAGYNDSSAALEQNQAVQQYRQEMQGDMTVDDRENSLTAFLSQLFMDTQGQWIQAHMDEYEQGLTKYRQALLEYKRGGVALNVALERQGLAPLAGNDIRVASYAADQVMTQEGAKERAKARAEENAETNTGGGERYSLKTLPDGRKYVDVDTDQHIFDGKEENEFKHIARNYIREHFLGKSYQLGETSNRAKVVGKTAREYAYPANKRINGEIKTAKLKASTEIDNLIQASQYLRHENDDGRHPDAIGGWDVYTTIFGLSGRLFEGETKIMITESGEGILYDVTKIRDITRHVRTTQEKGSRGLDNISYNNISNSDRNVNEKFSLRHSPKGTAEENKSLQDKAIEIFGKTYNWTTTGYLLPDGTKLDFSGKRYGSNGRYREEDHREILEAYGEDSDLSGTEAMIDFMGRGAMRIMPESGGIQMQTPPTKQQLQALDAFISKMRGEVTIDIDDENGNTVFSKDYDRGTYSRTIIADIPSLFEEAGRSRSETAQFHSRYSLPSRQRQEADAEYMEAVENGDEETARRLVDDAARAAGYDAMGYHGSRNFGFNRFDLGMGQGTIFVSFDDPVLAQTYTKGAEVRSLAEQSKSLEDMTGMELYIWAEEHLKTVKGSNGKNLRARVFYDDDAGTFTLVTEPEQYGEDRKRQTLTRAEMIDLLGGLYDKRKNEGVYQLYTKSGNQLVIDAKGDSWRDITVPWDDSGKTYKTREIAEYARNNGYDSVRINNVYDGGGISARSGEDGFGDIGIFFKAEDVKSADVVTRDDQGHVIPLSERFDTGKEDIRYSLPSRQRQQADAAEWVRDDAELYAQLKQDEDARAALWMIERIYRNTTTGEGRTVLSEADLKKRLPEVVKRLKEQTGTTVSVKEMTKQIMTLWEALQKPGYQMGEMMQYARNMIKRWIESAPGMMAEQDETTKEILQTLKHPFSLTPDMKSEIKGTFGDARDFYRKNIGKMRIKNDAKSTLADVWQETLTKLNPGVFAPDATEADMPIILDAWLETAGKREYSGDFGANVGAMSTDLAMNTILELFNTPDILQTRYEMNKARVDRTYQLYQAAERLVATVREGYKQKYQERIERDRQTKAEREAKQGVINEIKRNVKPLKTMLVKGTDNRHIPEAMRGAMERMLNNLGVDRAIFSGQEARELYMKLGKWAADSQLHDAAEAAAYDPDILAKLEWLEEHAGKSKALRDMTMQELEAVRDAVQNMYKMVTEENEIEVNGRKRKVSDLAGAVMGEMKDKKEASSNPVLAFLRKVGFKEMTPVYYAKQVGGTLGDLINDMIRSESDVAFIIKDAKGAFDKAAEKYHLNEWIHDKNHLRFQTSAGDTIELTREQAMTLYAWAEREKRNKTQSAAHLRRGGFTYDRNDADVKKMKGVNFTKSHVLSDADVTRIRNYLTDEQRGFVETMVKYLSEDMAEKGNEASMRMFGWKKFGEKWYFPYPTDRNFRGKNSTDAKGQPDKQIKYMGSSHALTENAMNPLKLDSFTNIWAEHVDEMARYSVMAEKLDNLQRVTNYVVGGLETETGEVFAPESVKKEIERALGQEGAHYLEQLIRDANGGVMGDERGLSDKFISLFKKGSVAANMSVILQQPSAFVRAMSMVNPRYFGRGLHEHGGFKATKERMYANSGVANLKQWGGFDTNTGGTFANTLLDSMEKDGKLEKTRAFIDEWTGKGAEKADEITWVYMYSAIEAEIDDRTDYKRGTEDFNKAVARRFDEVMRATQVYDSSMAKSEWMRSTSTMDKIVTSFMAEPTLWINMMMDAALDLKNNAPGARGKAARAVGVFVAGTFVNSLLQSIATAFRRKKDEGTTIVEKYLSELASNFTDSLSIEGIAGMIPIARDIVSLFQGYDVERADMAVIGNMIDAWRKMEQHMKKGEMPDVDEWMNLAGMAGNMFGVPVRNIYRDVSGIIMNTFGGASSPIGETSGRDILYSVLEDTSWNSFVKLWDPSNAAYYDRMEQALIKGDMDKYNELRGYLEDTKKVKGDTISTGIKNELKESVLRGLVTEEKAVDIMVNLLGVKDEKTAFDQIDKYVAKAKANGDEDFEYSKYAGLMDAVKSGGDVEAEIKRLEERGNARKTVVSNIKSQVKDWYLAGDMTKAQAEKALKTYVGISDSDNSALYWTLDEWDWLKANPNGTYKSYGNIFDAVDSGNAQKIKAAVQKHLDHPHTKQMATDVHRQITDHFKPIYVELWNKGKKTEAANLKAAILTAYEAAGYARDMKNKDIDKWVK